MVMKEQLRFGWDENEGGEWNVSGLVGQLMVLGRLKIMGKPIHVHSALFLILNDLTSTLIVYRKNTKSQEIFS